MSLSKSLSNLNSADRHVLLQAFQTTQMQRVLAEVSSWAALQMCNLDPDSEEFNSEYRRIFLTKSIFDELAALSKQELEL